LALLLAALQVNACAPTLPERRLAVALPAAPASLTPNVAHDAATLAVLGNIYETLVGVDANLGLQPGLAESWHTPDELGWVFRIRAGVQRHDGAPLTAADVAASLEHARADPASCRRAQLADVDRIELDGPLTIRIRTRRPIDTLAMRLGNVFIGARPAHGGGIWPGTGRYRLGSRTPNGLVLEAFPGHRDGPPALPVARFEALSDPDELAHRLRDGQLQLAVDLPAAGVAALSSAPNVRTLVRSDGLRVTFLGFDCARARSPGILRVPNPFRDLRVRQAVALAIDRAAIVQGPLAGYAELVDQIATADALGAYRDSLGTRPHDPAGARRLLEAAGHAGGFQARLDHAADPDTKAVARSIARDLGRIGIRLELAAWSEADLERRIAQRKTSLHLGAWTGETGDGRLAYEYLLHTPRGNLGQANAGSCGSPALDTLIRRATGLESARERSVLLARLAAKVALEAAIVPLYAKADIYAAASDLAFEPRLDRQVRLAELRWQK